VCPDTKPEQPRVLVRAGPFGAGMVNALKRSQRGSYPIAGNRQRQQHSVDARRHVAAVMLA